MKIRSGFANGSWYFVDVSDNRKKLFVSKQIVMHQQIKHETCLLNSTFYMLEISPSSKFCIQRKIKQSGYFVDI